jgi:hypothetical protein
MKASKVVFIDDSLQRSFNQVPNNDPIKSAMKRAFNNIEKDVFCGRNVKKKLIPKKLIERYKINNLWIYNLPNGWRLLYSVTSDGEIEIIAAILDWMDHKDYERLFGF